MDKKKMQKIEEISKEVDEEISSFDVLDILLDPDNTDPIILIDEKNNKRITFEQVAIVPYNDKIYTVLKPVDKIENVADDEAIVFYVDETVKPSVLRVEEDEQTAIKIFDEYYNLIEEANKNADSKKGKKGKK